MDRLQLQSRCRGFTLLELLVATAIFAAVAVVSFSSLNAVLNTQEHTDKAATQLHRLQLGMAIMQRDFTQMVHVSIRDEFGDIQPALLFNERDKNAERLIEFTRNGWNNPAEQLRSNLQRVAYTLEDEKLYREYWPQLNRGPSEPPPVRALLLEDVEELTFEFEDFGKNWHDRWPPLNSSGDVGLPQAIRMTLTRTDKREVIRMFDITAL